MGNTGKRQTDLASLEGYIVALSRRLRWMLPNDKADAIVAETEAHLTDHADDLEASGMARSMAEAAAVGGFGSVASFARAVAKSAFEDKASVRARRWAAVLGCAWVAFWINWTTGCVSSGRWLEEYTSPNWVRSCLHTAGWFLGDTSAWMNTSEVTMRRGEYLGSAVFVAFLISAFRGKRPQTALFASFGVLGTLVAFVCAGQNEVIVDSPLYGHIINRSRIAEHQPDPNYEACMERDVHLLSLGCRVFQASNPIVPAELMSHGQIMIPPIDITADRTMNTNVALRQDASHAQLEALPKDDPNNIAWNAAWNSAPYRTAATMREAQKAWREVGRDWLEARTGALHDYRKNELWWRTLQTNVSTRFSAMAGLEFVGDPVSFSLYILLVDMLAAFAGQHVHRFLQNGRRGSYA